MNIQLQVMSIKILIAISKPIVSLDQYGSLSWNTSKIYCIDIGNLGAKAWSANI